MIKRWWLSDTTGYLLIAANIIGGIWVATVFWPLVFLNVFLVAILIHTIVTCK